MINSLQERLTQAKIKMLSTNTLTEILTLSRGAIEMSFSPRFKAGDKLVCIDASDTELTVRGDIYTATDDSYIGSCGFEYVCLDELVTDGRWKKGMLIERFELAKSPFFGKKYRVTPETSELLQKEVFKAGGSWTSGHKEFLYANTSFIYVDKEGFLGLGSAADFNNNPSPEATLEVVKTVIIKDIIPVETEQQRKVRELEEKLEVHKATMKDLEEQIKGMKE